MQIKKKYDLTILMIEHHMELVMKCSDRIYVVRVRQTHLAGHARRCTG